MVRHSFDGTSFFSFERGGLRESCDPFRNDLIAAPSPAAGGKFDGGVCGLVTVWNVDVWN